MAGWHSGSRPAAVAGSAAVAADHGAADTEDGTGD